ncbi:hypothetical protein OE88DRAFT_1735931 [Heliocybe sulcata]|uniref:Uncharacterized protein n=1 Tax=Heliocybe sulcata TaxID=5364 RepID=A0A5C3MYG9_9AGAM|nr:hypothetical protein OE88DRAFT_1735931 [Heliocybe sulcata]
MRDIFHNLTGEADDKSALISKGMLSDLEQQMNSVNVDVVSIISTIKNALAPLSSISKDIGNLVQKLDASQAAATKAEKDSSAFQPGRIAQGSPDSPDPLWQVLEPVFSVHDELRRFLIEHEDQLEIPIIGPAMKKVGEYIDLFVYKMLALVIEPSVEQMRKAVEAGKLAAGNPETGIWHAGSTDTDPSHSDIAKDHFSHVLNPLAGLVSSVTTNYTVQQIVRCWDDEHKDADAVITDVLSILHHPAFATSPTLIQRYMRDAVEGWWKRSITDAQREELRANLSKAAVRNNGHNCHSTDVSHMHSIKTGFGVFPDSSYEGRLKKNESSIGNAFQQVLVNAGDKLKEAAGAVGDGAAAMGKSIVDGASTMATTIGDTATTVYNGAEKALTDIGNGASQAAASLVRAIKFW